LPENPLGVGVQPFKERARDATVLGKGGVKQMLDIDRAVVVLLGGGLRALEDFLDFDGKFIESHSDMSA